MRGATHVILLCGIPSESPMALVIDQLLERGVPFLMLNQREFDAWNFTWTFQGGRIRGALALDGNTYDLSTISSVYARLMDDRQLPELDGVPPGSLRRLRCRNLHEALVGWMDIARCRVVNRVRKMGSNASKPYQAQLIRRHGFLTPDTLVTNDPTLVRAFAEQHGRVVYKSISGFRSIVSELDDADLARLDEIHACPVQFQEYIPGFDLRVHTIGNEVFATRIDSPGTDYRYANHGDDGTRLQAYEPPADLADRCWRLSAVLGLDFAGIDLRITPDGALYAFEVNPCPAYSYYEAHTGQPISLALARYLAGATD
jgi:ribosomal protein S6-L-glutamate ligase RimK-like protein